jgi:hypothetical protein
MDDSMRNRSILTNKKLEGKAGDTMKKRHRIKEILKQAKKRGRTLIDDGLSSPGRRFKFSPLHGHL